MRKIVYSPTLKDIIITICVKLYMDFFLNLTKSSNDTPYTFSFARDKEIETIVIIAGNNTIINSKTSLLSKFTLITLQISNIKNTTNEIIASTSKIYFKFILLLVC